MADADFDAALNAINSDVAELVRAELARRDTTIAQQETILAQQETILAQQETILAQQGATIAQQETTIADQENTIVQQQIVTVQMARATAQLLFDAGRYADALGFMHKAYALTGLTAPHAFTQVVDAFYRAAQGTVRPAGRAPASLSQRSRRFGDPGARGGRGAAVRVCRLAVAATSDARRAQGGWIEQLNCFLFQQKNYTLHRGVNFGE